VVEIRACEKKGCGVLFPVYQDTNYDEKYCVKHRGRSLENHE